MYTEKKKKGKRAPIFPVIALINIEKFNISGRQFSKPCTSDWLLFNAKSAMREQVNFQWDYDEVRFVLDRHFQQYFSYIVAFSLIGGGNHNSKERLNLYYIYIVKSCFKPIYYCLPKIKDKTVLSYNI
jgi:hypothetical protein